MTIQYPTALDVLINPSPADTLDSEGVLHTDQHGNANDAIEALEAKVGVTGSVDTNSLDYRVNHIPAGVDGIDGTNGTNGTNGTTPVKGVDYSDGVDGADSTVPGPQGEQGIQGVPGNNGAPGADGADGAPGTTTWAGITDKPATFTPEAHNQATSTITGLDTALSGKEAANSNIQTHVTSAHAPAGAQANADITKAEIEAKLTGAISTHTHGYEAVGVANTEATDHVATHAALKTGVHGLLGGVRIRTQGAPDAETGANTLTIADLLTGIVVGTPAGAVAYTLPTGTLCDAGMTIGINEAFDWILINVATVATYIITLTAGVGHTIVGNAKIPSNSTTTGGLWGTSGQRFRTRKTAANTFVTYGV